MNVDSLGHVAATQLPINEIGVCETELNQPIALDSDEQSCDTGGFILIDRITSNTVRAGMPLRAAFAQSVDPALTVYKKPRWRRPCVKPRGSCGSRALGAGKSTIANRVEAEVHARRNHTCPPDGDDVRQDLNRDLGFTDAGGVDNIRRVAEVPKLMVGAGLIGLAPLISPLRSE